ncbi:uncharacterized protein LOC142230494 [Haematobia irritans]|uniref:uncharacterized protein LOC142230494 n=1 Tax=Haematobia irritans TaxID=7368 RepID=UPI003F504E76
MIGFTCHRLNFIDLSLAIRTRDGNDAGLRYIQFPSLSYLSTMGSREPPWCNGYHARLAYAWSWVRTQFRPNTKKFFNGGLSHLSNAGDKIQQDSATKKRLKRRFSASFLQDLNPLDMRLLYF